MLRAQNGSHITTLGPKYIPYNYMEPLGFVLIAQAGDDATAVENSCSDPFKTL